MSNTLILGSHVGMSGSKMFLASVEEALSYGANTFMVYTGAPQNTRRKAIKDLNIEAASAKMKEYSMFPFIVHAPYIINLANTIKPEIYELATSFLATELERTAAMGSHTLVLHPGSHVGAGEDAGIQQIIKGLNEVLTADTDVNIALETMAGKGSEVGFRFEQLAAIYDGVIFNDKLRVCFDTCHVNDSGYDLVHHLDETLQSFDKILGLSQIAALHINDSKNPLGASKDRHENIGFGSIGFETLNQIVHLPEFASVPKILESPYVPVPGNEKNTVAPYRHEIAMLRSGVFNPSLKEDILQDC